jgi:integrase
VSHITPYNSPYVLTAYCRGVKTKKRVVEKYARLAGLEGVSAHTLRHTFGKSLLDSGTDLVAVASLLGHSRLDTTAIYTQPTPQDLTGRWSDSRSVKSRWLCRTTPSCLGRRYGFVKRQPVIQPVEP